MDEIISELNTQLTAEVKKNRQLKKERDDFEAQLASLRRDMDSAGDWRARAEGAKQVCKCRDLTSASITSYAQNFT
jgi:hypothetical protein